MSVSLDKVTYRSAIGEHSHLEIIGRPVKISDQHVWIMARSVTGRYTRADYPVPPAPVKVDRSTCYLYR